MDSAIDSLSTTSERSNASSSIGGSPANLSHSIKTTMSPSISINHNNNNSINNNNNSGGNHHNSSNSIHNHGNNSTGRTPSNSSALHNAMSSESSHHHHHRHSSVSPLHSRSPRSSPLDCGPPQMHSLHHSLSPPQVSTPSNLSVMQSRMPQGMPHLPPHGIGLLNSLQMIHHGSPLELMAAAHHQMPPRTYNSPPPISSSDPTANECKLVEYRGQKVAAFIISGDTMLCLPQAFELFLKHLVGGLHTVYTKLKRLDIVPLVCNVEQVRILRGLGAIQPGVNRCKLLSCKDFDILYRDCTTARCLSVKPPESSRPGRPPKRGPVGLSLSSPHMQHHPHMKKHRLDNGDYPYENGHINDISRLDKSPLLANGYNAPPTHLNPLQYMQMSHHPGAAAANLMNSGITAHNLGRGPDGVMGVKGQTGIPSVDAIARSGIWENCRAAYEDIVKHLERYQRPLKQQEIANYILDYTEKMLRDEKVDERGIVRDHKLRDLSSQNGSPNGHSPILNLSKSGIDHNSIEDRSEHSEERSPAPSTHHADDEDNISDRNESDNEDRDEKDDTDYADSEVDCELPPVSSASSVPGSDQPHPQALNYSSMAIPNAPPPNIINEQQQEQNLSSTETLLRNIQNLIKVATENARQQERQTSYEKAELKMDVLREREVKDSVERQLNDERRLRIVYQKRFKREKRVRSRIQQQLDLEIKRRTHLEDAIKSTGASVESLRSVAGATSNDISSHDPADRPHSASEKKLSDNSYSHSNCDTQSPQHNHSQSQSQSHQRDHRDRDSQPPPPPSTSSSSSAAAGTQGGIPPLGAGGPPPSNPDGKPWNYSNIDLMATGAFWHNYSESLAHEFEMERKVRQQTGESELKSPPIPDRPNYFKNSVLFTSAT